MLREKILPTGIGHTTNCFLQVEGADSNEESCIYTPDNDKPQNIKVIFCLNLKEKNVSKNNY
jgi:mitofusin